jgi:isopentenyl phosphate kinase
MVKALVNAGIKFVLVLGAGSFGHPIVSRYGINDEGGLGVSYTRQGVTELGHLVTTTLTSREVPAVLVSPFSLGLFDKGTRRKL